MVVVVAVAQGGLGLVRGAEPVVAVDVDGSDWLLLAELSDGSSICIFLLINFSLNLFRNVNQFGRRKIVLKRYENK